MADQDSTFNEVVYIRRCHVCGCINESSKSSMSSCHHCGKHLVPFLFCPDVGSDLVKAAFGASSKETKAERHSSVLRSEYPPIYGISLYW